MMDLDLSRINMMSPYSVWKEGDTYLFKTDYDIVYAVSFDYEEIRGFNAYWFNLANTSIKPSPNDKKIMQTIICIIESFFHSNPDFLLYICDIANDQQAQRDRLFLRWFNGYMQKQQYVLRTTMVMDEDEPNYLSLIVMRKNPQIENILTMFDQETAMFKSNK